MQDASLSVVVLLESPVKTLLGQAPKHWPNPIAGEVARAPATPFWSHGDLAVVFSASKPEQVYPPRRAPEY